MEMEEKRARDDDEEEGGHGDCLKKLCRGLGIVEEDDEEQELERRLHRQQEEDDEQDISEVESGLDREELLSGVIKSLEEEINLSSASSSPAAAPPPPPPPQEQHYEFVRQYSSTSSVDLSYLLEASDDELGISIASPALSEADLSCPVAQCSEEQLRANNLLDLLEGEVITLSSSDFPEFEEEWIRRTVATMEMVVDSPPPPPPEWEDCSSAVPGIGSATSQQPLLIESRK